ncbi:RHS repeat-associated core domain-containing protein [Pseudomonas putida]|uniref:RHS repeat-associated core domain-containing protein n=1 Tax=Pseudomonas putida TaxID=303 RepID=UPI0018E69090|nr:RHS repeat-associated core domain-containing protein [Pseudomonas putida]MBI6925960.1 RHS repeat-associated core domain-containing protein [Pseudomonas putida]
MCHKASLVSRTGQAFSYLPYGDQRCAPRLCGLAYSGQLLDAVTGGYLLKRRMYQPQLRRFYSPDPLSPFLKGGLNAYAYCENDPVNFNDLEGSYRLKIHKKNLKPVLKKIDNGRLRIKAFSYDASKPEGERIDTFRAKVVDRKVEERRDSSVSMSGLFYVNEDQSMFISEVLVADDRLGSHPLKNFGFIETGFSLKNVNPTHFKVVNGKIVPESNMIWVSESGITDFSKGDLQLPGLNDAIRKGRPEKR